MTTERARDGDDGARRCELETGDHGGELETMTMATMFRLIERDAKKVVVMSVTAPGREKEKDVE